MGSMGEDAAVEVMLSTILGLPVRRERERALDFLRPWPGFIWLDMEGGGDVGVADLSFVAGRLGGGCDARLRLILDMEKFFRKDGFLCFGSVGRVVSCGFSLKLLSCRRRSRSSPSSRNLKLSKKAPGAVPWLSWPDMFDRGVSMLIGVCDNAAEQPGPLTSSRVTVGEGGFPGLLPVMVSCGVWMAMLRGLFLVAGRLECGLLRCPLFGGPLMAESMESRGPGWLALWSEVIRARRPFRDLRGVEEKS